MATAVHPPQMPNKCRNSDVETVTELVTNARAKVLAFAQADGFHAQKKVKKSLGQNEGLCSLMQLAVLDEDGDGNLSEAELDQFHEQGQRMIDATLNSFLNQGVVGALVLSIIFPLAADTDLELSWNGLNGEFDAKFVLNTIGFLALIIAVTLSVLLISATSTMYSQLSFMMPTMSSKLWYMDRTRHLLTYIEVSKNCVLIYSCVYLLFTNLAKNAWLGFLAVLPVLVPCVVLECYFIRKLIPEFDHQLHCEAKGMLKVHSPPSRVHKNSQL